MAIVILRLRNYIVILLQYRDENLLPIRFYYIILLTH